MWVLEGTLDQREKRGGVGARQFIYIVKIYILLHLSLVLVFYEYQLI